MGAKSAKMSRNVRINKWKVRGARGETERERKSKVYKSVQQPSRAAHMRERKIYKTRPIFRLYI